MDNKKLVKKLEKKNKLIAKAKEMAETIMDQDIDNPNVANVSFVQAAKKFLIALEEGGWNDTNWTI